MYLRFKAQDLFDEVMITEKPKWNLKGIVNNLCFIKVHTEQIQTSTLFVTVHSQFSTSDSIAWRVCLIRADTG